MALSTFGLRMAMRLSRPAPKEEENSKVPYSRKQMSDTHGYLFLLLGISMATNLNTSLLTEKVFRCQNFANKCMGAYIVFTFTGAFALFFLINLNFSAMVLSVWLLVASHSMHVLVGMFGNGLMARNIFILGYGFNGALEALICFSGAGVISKLFLNSTYSMIYTGFPAGSIFLGTTQTILNRVVGTATISQMRKNLVLCHGCQALISTIAAIWATLLYIKYGHFVKDNEENKTEDEKKSESENKKPGISQKFADAIESFKYTRFYYSRLILVTFAYSMRYFFFPCLLPFVLDIPHHIKLICSLSLTLSEFISKLNSVNINEVINPSERSPSQSHDVFLLMRDAYLHFIAIASITSSALVLWSSLTGRHRFTQSPIFIFCFIVLMGISYGYLSTRSINGCKPVLDYYTKQRDNKGNPMVKEEIANGPGVSGVTTLTINMALVFISIFSNVTEGFIVRYKGSIAYILNNSKGELSMKAVDALLMQLKS
ncbi:conserved hypothetical protein [Theileria equi strain WA]|uniref:Uncharacterized protein n=1 Tax=Theileria equi strain WA TaxID=1537102 RepID=L1LAW3_THEEQ|nr:conserved hypothetical protein [Theileria equi strain WA]EKX72404.1 conserved hypothetical protein [Theileria equi strain WA]|eukprot:XP_004831856.1 conserved hypothetical protein [Theileria equi strain WA]